MSAPAEGSGPLLSETNRRHIVGVMGSGREPHRQLARAVGELIARSGHHLLTGGGYGVMEEVCRAFCSVAARQGLSIGVIRSRELPVLDPQTGARVYSPARVNAWIEVPIYTHLPASSEGFDSRNHLNVLSADTLIVLPGGAGTLSELRLRLQYGRPAVAFLGPPEEGLQIAGNSAGALAAEHPQLLSIAHHLEELEEWMQRP